MINKTFFLLLLFIPFFAIGQNTSTPKKKKWAYTKVNENGSYLKLLSEGMQNYTVNFFTGPDVENFKTTLKGFGSIGNGYEFSMITVGNKHFAAFADLGLSLRYYRFEKNLKLTKTDNSVEDAIVENPPYEFKNTFFSWSKNKMVTGYLTIPVGFDIKFRPVDIRLQASYIRYLSGKHKIKYNDTDDAFENKGKIAVGWLAGDEREKFKTPNSEFKDYFINKNNITLSVMIIPKLLDKRIFSFGVKYDLKPLFTENKGPEIHETAIVFCFDFDE